MKSWPVKTRVILFVLPIACLVLSVLLYNVNRTPPRVTEGNKKVAVNDFSVLVEAAETALPKDLAQKWKLLSARTGQPTKLNEKISWQDSVIAFWDNINRPDISAVFSKKKAESTGLAKDWNYSGQRFYFAVRFSREPSKQELLYTAARECFEKTLMIEPDNINAKIDLASCLVEGSREPMKGIAILREIEKKDSNNVRLQLSFGFFSAKSQQWDRAIKRFKKVLALDSGYIEAHLHLADAYEQSGKLPECINELERFVRKTSDPMAKTTIEEYINKLKEKN